VQLQTWAISQLDLMWLVKQKSEQKFCVARMMHAGIIFLEIKFSALDDTKLLSVFN
jgi:hypothetical protein